jgi:hypothetical protein
VSTMSWGGEAQNLSWPELETAVRWFGFHMTAEQRGKMMAELPTLYAKLNPTVSPDLIAGKVAAQIRADRENDAVAAAAAADQVIADALAGQP